MGLPVNLVGFIGLFLQGRKDVVPDAGLSPAIEAARYRAVRAVAVWDIPPRRACTQNPQDTIDDAPMVRRRLPGPRLLRWQQRLQLLPLFVG